MQKRSINERRTRRVAPVALMASALVLSGCAGPVIGALTLGEISTIAGLASTLISGQDLTEHALSLATGEDCRILEAILRENRAFCEHHGAPETEHDFKGLASLFANDEPPATAIADARPSPGSLDLLAVDPMTLGFAPIDRPLDFSEFSLAMIADETTPARAPRLSFGFMSATFGQS